MGAVTYPNAGVQAEIEQHFVPVQYNVKDEPDVMDRFHTPWTPTLIVEDAVGVEHRRSQGYLDANRFIAEMATARLKEAIDRRDFKAAVERIPEAEERTRDDPFRAPEVAYWAAVARYKAADNPDELVGGWNRLLDTFPDSEWAKKASFIRL
jgi:hypothetical protein